MPGTASAVLEMIDAQASAAGLHKGDILVAINGRPFTGNTVFWEEIVKGTPGSALGVTVRSPRANPQEHTVLMPVTQNHRWVANKAVIVAVGVVMPAFCIALGFWVVLVRPNDPLAWLLLGLLLSFTQVVNTSSLFVSWGPGILHFAVGYNWTMKMAWPIFMFLFGFFFPEPLPFFRRPGAWRRWLPWIAIAPFALSGLGFVAVAVAELTNYSAAQPIYRILGRFDLATNLYAMCLISGFFALIFSKSSIAISPDAKRRLRLLYWGATIALTPLLLAGLTEWIRGVEVPDWAVALVLLTFLIFPITLAYVIVVQRAMDVRVVLRQGLQYALAKNGIRTLQVLAMLVVSLTALALIQQNRERPQKLIVIVLGLIAIFTIRRMTDKTGDWLDRRFFREAYDAEQVLAELSDGVHGMVDARSLIETSPSVSRRRCTFHAWRFC